MKSFKELSDTNVIAKQGEFQENISSSPQLGSMASTGKMNIRNTEAMIVEETKSLETKLTQLCPRFLERDFQITIYGKDYEILETPVFRNPIRKLKDGEGKNAEMDLIEDSIKKIEETLKPANRNQIKEELGRLLLHKGFGKYTEEQWHIILKDYIEDMSVYPYDLIIKACKECRQDAAMQFFPQVGRLLDKMAREMTLRQLYLGRLRKILELSQHQEQRPMTARPQELGASLAERFKPRN